MTTGSYYISGSYCITGSAMPFGHYPMPMAEALQEKTGEVQEYFEKLGYEVSWDFSNRSGERWWEISDEDGLIVQIDMGVSLTHIVEDICSFHLGTPCVDRPDKPDYKLSGPDSDKMKELFKKVYEDQRTKI